MTTNHYPGAATTASPQAAFPLQRPGRLVRTLFKAGARRLLDAVREGFAVAFGCDDGAENTVEWRRGTPT
jgi:hypothetical protein